MSESYVLVMKEEKEGEIEDNGRSGREMRGASKYLPIVVWHVPLGGEEKH